jgi:adenylate cyclase
VAAEGGEVLKFIGNAMLAIFPIGEDPAATCAKGLRSRVARRGRACRGE